MTEVSVIIPTFNRADKVVRAISSVLAQTFTDFKIIVVDDGSEDQTSTALKQFGSKIKLITHPENRGVSAARNSGVYAAKSDLIALLDSDDHWLPDKLKVQTDFFREHPDAVACQTGELWVRNGRRVNPKKKHIKPSGCIFEPSLKLCLVSPSAVMLKRSLLDEVGLFDEELPVCEDYDLWLRISCQYPIELIEQNLIIKEGGHSDQLSSSLKGMDRFRIRSMVKLLGKDLLNEKQATAVIKELKEKCRVYGEGCLKRGKVKEGKSYLKLLGNLNSDEYQTTDS